MENPAQKETIEWRVIHEPIPNDVLHGFRAGYTYTL